MLRDYIDQFILDTQSNGSTFTRADVKAWADREGLTFDVGSALIQHRQSPKQRVFTTERVGMGPKSFYRVVEGSKSVHSAAVLRMHQQQGVEMVRRWIRERDFRMAPLAARRKKADAYIRQAEAEVKAIATLLHVRLDGLEMDDDDE